MTVCPYCKAEINSVHVTVKEIAFVHYEVSVSENILANGTKLARKLIHKNYMRHDARTVSGNCLSIRREK